MRASEAFEQATIALELAEEADDLVEISNWLRVAQTWVNYGRRLLTESSGAPPAKIDAAVALALAPSPELIRVPDGPHHRPSPPRLTVADEVDWPDDAC